MLVQICGVVCHKRERHAVAYPSYDLVSLAKRRELMVTLPGTCMLNVASGYDLHSLCK